MTVPDLTGLPRVGLGFWPTPLMPADHLRAEIGGPRIWLKRDDCSGLALGGNKTRKLEFLIGQALHEGATAVATFGALQSNHVRQTAAACARHGLDCHVFLTRMVARTTPAYTQSGNVMLDALLGAQVHVVADADAAFHAFARVHARYEQAGEMLFTIPPGGSTAVGALGYVDAAVELLAQCADAGVVPARVVVAASTAGTAAGLAVGLALVDAPAPLLDVVCVYEPAAVTSAELDRLAAETAAMLGVRAPDPNARIVGDDQLGPGYGVPTPAARNAIELLARTEGVLLDPVYTAKAFAHILDAVLTGTVSDDGDVVFVHTGGAPGLFAYADEFAPPTQNLA